MRKDGATYAPRSPMLPGEDGGYGAHLPREKMDIRIEQRGAPVASRLSEHGRLDKTILASAENGTFTQR